VAYRQRSFFRQETGDGRGAIEDYDQVIEMNPHDAEALRGRGYIRLKQHELGAAIDDLTAAIALNPRDALAFRFRSLAYTAKRDSKRAEIDDATARKLDPTAR
jgi:tetratricopeptide (TPR) repeat protein